MYMFRAHYIFCGAPLISLFFIFQFMMLKGPDTKDEKVECMEHCEKFWFWLQSKGISAHRSAIVKAVASKMNGALPGIYDSSMYEEDEEEE